MAETEAAIQGADAQRRPVYEGNLEVQRQVAEVIDAVETPDASTLVLRLKEPSANLLYRLGWPASVMIEPMVDEAAIRVQLEWCRQVCLESAHAFDEQPGAEESARACRACARACGEFLDTLR